MDGQAYGQVSRRQPQRNSTFSHSTRPLPALPLCLFMWSQPIYTKYKQGQRADKYCQTFAKQDLPKEHRVLKPDSMSTMDFKPDRLNIHVSEDGTVQNVRYG